MSPPITAEQLAALPPEVRAVVEALMDHYERRIAALEAELSATKQELAAVKKTPRNSSLPPSSEHPHAKPLPEKPKSPRKQGGTTRPSQARTGTHPDRRLPADDPVSAQPLPRLRTAVDGE